MSHGGALDSTALSLPGGVCTLEPADFCAWPGYCLLRMAGGAHSPAELPDEEAAGLGLALARCVRALERVTGAERVYLLAFAEADRRFHVHLLPRTRRLAEAWAAADGRSLDGPVDGPALFQWVRAACVTQEQVPADLPGRDETWAALCRELAGV